MSSWAFPLQTPRPGCGGSTNWNITGAQFALREDLSVGALRWWSSVLGRGTRAQHGRSPIEPIEIAVPPHVRVYLTSQPVDMRAGHDGLFAIVKSWRVSWSLRQRIP
jgi:hypothetical protein